MNRRIRRPTTPTRRDALRLGGLSLAAASLASCDLLTTDPAEEGGDGGATQADRAKEAPDLATAVKAGDLPPLEERLPTTPMVLEVAEVGRYGGDLNLLGLGEDFADNTTLGYENLLRYKPGIETDLTPDNVIPNVAESFDIGADGAEYTFHLREGMKWSDGEPFTADDIVFWYESVAMNTELTPVFIDWLDTGDDHDSLVVEKVDDYTVVFRFSRPNGLFVVNMASQRGTGITNFPAHYLQQFHPDFVDDIDALVEESDQDNWVDMFRARANRKEDPERPVIDAWKLTSAVSETQRPIAERNPYYWKADPDGRQLPYIDRVTFDLVQEEEAAILKATNGDFHVVVTGINQLRNKPVFADSREEGEYEFFDTIPQNMNQMVVMVNMTHQDPVLREIFSNRDFRVGLSYAMNRQEIIDAVFQRQGQPWQAAPRPESPYHNEELATQYTEYDPDLANEHLDRVLPDKNANGVRLRPDGKPLSFQIETPDHELDFVDALELISNHWGEVGVQMTPSNVDTDLFFERMDANSHDGAVWEGAGGHGAPMDPFYWVPHNFNTRYAMPWHFWILNPDDERAEEPPPETLAQIELYRDMLTTGDDAERDEKMRQIMDNAIDLFYCMGTALRLKEYGIVSTRLRNTPELSPVGWLHAQIMPSNPQQYFFAEE